MIVRRWITAARRIELSSALEWPFLRSFACAQDDEASVAGRRLRFHLRRERRLARSCNAGTSLL
jgi:hypothetical protein